MLDLLFGHVWPEPGAVADSVILATKGTLVLVEQDVKPEGHLIAVMLGGPIVRLLQGSDEQLFVYRGGGGSLIRTESNAVEEGGYFALT